MTKDEYPGRCREVVSVPGPYRRCILVRDHEGDHRTASGYEWSQP